MRIDLFADWFDPRVKLESLFFFLLFLLITLQRQDTLVFLKCQLFSRKP